MTDRYQPPKSTVLKRREYKVPVILILIIGLVTGVAVYFAHYLLNNFEDKYSYAILDGSFLLFLVFSVAKVFTLLYLKRQVDQFLLYHPIIDNQRTLVKFKSLVRRQMRIALVQIILYGLALFFGMLVIWVAEDLFFNGLIMLVLILDFIFVKWYKASENRAKQVQCSDESLMEELNKVLQCWWYKALPNF